MNFSKGEEPLFGAIEAGGTKFVCGIGTCPEDLTVRTVRTGEPDPTMAEVIDFFLEHRAVEAIGVGSFGPIDRFRGQITSTPKIPWRNYDICGVLRAALGVPVGFDTDVNAALLAEAHWGAGRGLSDFVYLTVGTGIGGGAMVNGEVLHGTMHAEMGHLRIPHDSARDPFPGVCPYHGDCLEGLASGPAMKARWNASPESLPAAHAAWDLEAHFLALGLASLACTLAPQRILLGGGVAQQVHLLELTRMELARLLNGYITAPELCPPLLGSRAGVLGGLILAKEQRDSIKSDSSS